jgi:Fur family peroxide stress response transcriptional regulator
MTDALLTTDDLVALLRHRGRRVTSQRLAVLRELRDRRGHASAPEIFASVRARLPGTSSPTVYAVLELLCELGLARKLELGVGVALYDARTEPHHHSVCRRCGDVADLDAELDPARLLTRAREGGFRPDGAELVVTGICAGCAGAAG